MTAKSKVRILIVEDEMIIARGMEQFLSDQDYEIEGLVSSGMDTLEMVKQKTPDIILMDIRIEGSLDGIETARQIWQNHRLPVIFITAFSDDELLTRAKEVESYGYLVKPIKEYEVLAMIEITLARAQMERKLRKREETYQRLYQFSPLGYQSLNENGEIIMVNEAWLDMLGYDESEVIGRSFADFILPDEIPLFKERFPEFKSRGETSGASFKMISKSGITLEVEFNGRILRDNQGGFQHTQCILNDITAWRKAQAEIQWELRVNQAMARLAGSLNSGVISITEISKQILNEGLQLTNSKSGCVASYYQTDETTHSICRNQIPEGWMNSFGTDSDDDSACACMVVLSEPGYFNSITSDDAPAGWFDQKRQPEKVIFVSAQVSEHRIGHIILGDKPEDYTQKDLDGLQKIADLYAVALQRIKAEDKLRDSENRFRKLFEHSNDAIFIHDIAGQILNVNQQACEMTMYNREELLGMNVLELGTQQDMINSTKKIENMVTARAVRFESEFVRKNRQVIAVDISSRLIDEEAGLVQGIVRDITRNKEILRNLRLNQKELVLLSKKMMLVQEAERKRISQELHDELGQSLTAIQINLSFINTNVLNSGDSALVKKINDTRDLVNQTIDQVRTLTLELRPTMLDDLGLLPAIRWYLNSVSERSRIQISLKAEHLDQRLDPDLEIVVFRVIQESITNILRHADAKNITVQIYCSNVLNGSIADDGCGFNIHEVLMVEKADRGYGLFGMKERVTTMGGKLDLKSEPGKGTTVSLELPIIKPTVEDVGAVQ